MTDEELKKADQAVSRKLTQASLRLREAAHERDLGGMVEAYALLNDAMLHQNRAFMEHRQDIALEQCARVLKEEIPLNRLPA